MSTKNNYLEERELREGWTVLERVKFELANKQYYSDEEYRLIITENHLEPSADYNKDSDQRNMLEAVYSIMQSLSNNMDLFRKIETEFATEDQAYKYLQLRLQDILARIEGLDDPEAVTDSNVGYMFYN